MCFLFFHVVDHIVGIFDALIDFLAGVLVLLFHLVRWLRRRALLRLFRRQRARDRDVVHHAVRQCIRINRSGIYRRIRERDVVDVLRVEHADGGPHGGPAGTPGDGADDVRQDVVRMRQDVDIAVGFRGPFAKRGQRSPVDGNLVVRRAAEPREQALKADLARLSSAKENIDRVVLALGCDGDAADVFRAGHLACVIQDIDGRIVARDVRARADIDRRFRCVLGDADDAANGVRSGGIRRDFDPVSPLLRDGIQLLVHIAIAIENDVNGIGDGVRIDADVRLAVQDGGVLL